MTSQKSEHENHETLVSQNISIRLLHFFIPLDWVADIIFCGASYGKLS
jgi:hypothetical protein